LAVQRGRATLSLRTPTGRYPEVTLGLNGRHQVDNARVAVRTLEACAARGMAVDEAAIIAGLRDVSWPARLEWLRLVDGAHVLIDAAHNPAGAAAMGRYLVDAAIAPLPIVLGILKDKDVDALVGALAPYASAVVATEVASPRALPAAELAACVERVRPALEVAVEPRPERALAAALAGGGPAAVAGSIFLVGPLRARLLAAGARSVAS
jgi:dihydrofolate synthase/folylpolyglutamate synthase